MGIVYILILLFIFVFIPLLLTTLNVIHIFKGTVNKCGHPDDPSFSGGMPPTNVFTVALGVIYTAIYHGMLNLSEWDTALIIISTDDDFNYHTPIARAHLPIIIFLFIASAVAYLYLLKKKNDAPPLALTLSISFIYAGIILFIVFIIQMSKNFLSHPLYIGAYVLYPFNYVLLSIPLLCEVIKNASSGNRPIKGSFNQFLFKFTSKTVSLPLLAFLSLIPITALCVGIFTLFGQAPDSAIKAFTETADWMLSTKEPPPSVYMDGHYLCTVGARGHKKLVRPIRYGVRHGHTVICNRQLLVANAFEDLIAEKLPRFHKLVRHVYDKYGYPIAKHIKTPIAADVTYILMLPLHFVFTVVLYLFDKNPENRIAVQYTGKRR